MTTAAHAQRPDAEGLFHEARKHRERWQRTISVGDASKNHEAPPLDVAPAPLLRVVDPAGARDPEPPSAWTTTRKAAVALGALGVAAGGTGIAFGVQANRLESQSDNLCPTLRCDPTATDLNRRARTDGLVANVGMIGGGALVVGAIALWIVGDTRPHDGVSIVPSVGPSGIGLAGAY
jgi:hypothetical protein